MPEKPPTTARGQGPIAVWNALWKKRLQAGVRWVVTLAVAMILTYLLVTQFLEGATPEPPSPEALREAAALREYANELLVLLEEFITKEPGEGVVEIAAYERWVERSFRPRVNDLRQRLVRADFSNAALTALLAAGDRAGALAGRPLDARAREGALGAAVHAARQIEVHIARLSADDRIRPAPFRPSFARD